MQAVESLTQLAVSAGNAAIGMATLKSQAAMAGIGMVQQMGGADTKNGKTGSQDNNTNTSTQSAESIKASAAAMTDPGALEVQKVLGYATTLQLLITGGPDGGPDWDKIRGSNGVRPTAKSRLLCCTDGPYSGKRRPLCRSGYEEH